MIFMDDLKETLYKEIDHEIHRRLIVDIPLGKLEARMAPSHDGTEHGMKIARHDTDQGTCMRSRQGMASAKHTSDMTWHDTARTCNLYI